MQKRIKLIDNILDHTNDGVIVIRTDGTIQSANNRALEILGYSQADFVGHGYTEIFTRENHGQLMAEIISAGLEKGIEYHLKKVDCTDAGGKAIHIKVSTSQLGGKDVVSKFVQSKSLVLFIKPVTDRPAAQSMGYANADNQYQQEIETLKEKNDELQKLLRRFDVLKIVIAGFVFVLFISVMSLTRNTIQFFPARSLPQIDSKAMGQLVEAKLDTVVKEIQLAGILEPYNKITIAAQTSGKVVKRNFKEGDYVAKDAILYQMDTKELAKKVRTARVAYMTLKEDYNKLLNWESSLEVMQAKRSFEIAKISLNNEKKKLQETKKLYEKGIIPRVEYDQAMTAFKKAQYDFENAKQTLESKMDKGSPEKLEMVKLKLSNAKQELGEIEAQYEATLIRAPVSGIVMLPVSSDGKLGSFKNEGDMVNEGDLVATIGATESYIINTSVGELNVKYVREGQRAMVTGPGFRNIVLQGKVDWVPQNASIEGNTRYYPVRISITDVPDSLRDAIRLGMLAEASIEIEKLADVVTVPVEAIYFEKNQNIVYVQDEEENVQARPVQVGYTDLAKIVVTQGLQPGEKVYIGKVAE